MGCKEVLPGIPSPPTGITIEASSNGLQVVLSWEAPGDTVDGYIIYFRGVNKPDFTVVETVYTTSRTVDPLGETGDYYVTAFNKSGESDPSEKVSTVPVYTSSISVYELNDPGGYAGYGWSRSTGSGSSYSMIQSSSIDVTDFYVTDWATGYSGPTFYLASPDAVSEDGGNQGGVPSGDWKTTWISEITSEDANGTLPSHEEYTNYEEAVGNSYYAVYTNDNHYAVVHIVGEVSSSGTMNVETWFQLIPGLRLIQH